jgi:hypothetical protein
MGTLTRFCYRRNAFVVFGGVPRPAPPSRLDLPLRPALVLSDDPDAALSTNMIR